MTYAACILSYTWSQRFAWSPPLTWSACACFLGSWFYSSWLSCWSYHTDTSDQLELHSACIHRCGMFSYTGVFRMEGNAHIEHCRSESALCSPCAADQSVSRLCCVRLGNIRLFEGPFNTDRMARYGILSRRSGFHSSNYAHTQESSWIWAHRSKAPCWACHRSIFAARELCMAHKAQRGMSNHIDVHHS